MNRYRNVCRLRWPAFLLLTGVIALLDQMDLISWGRAWPLYLILWGVLALAERAAIATEPPVPGLSSGFAPSAGFAPGYAQQPGPFAGPYATPAASTSPVQPAPPYQPVSSSGMVTVNGSLEVSSREVSTVDPASLPRKNWEEEGR